MTRPSMARRPDPASPASACYAPHSALYLRPDGQVAACCATGFTVGAVVGRHRLSLREIWDGAMLAAQQARLEARSYDFGCQECDVGERAAARPSTLAATFDRWAAGAPHPFPKLLDLALSNRCNLRCVMCNGDLSSSIRADREGRPALPAAYDDRFFDELEEFLPHAERLQFKGGEPFLATENRRIWTYLLDHGLRPEISVTTNGTVFNPNVEHLVRELKMHPIISIDAMDADLLASIRVGVSPSRLWRNIDRLQQVADEVGTGVTFSFCLMTSNWRELHPFLAEVDRRRAGVSVILVNQPDRYDLLRAAPDELASVLHALRSLPGDFASDQPRQEWRAVIDRIAAQVEAPVALRVSASPLRPMDLEEQERLVTRLASESGEPLLDVTVEADRVVQVSVPEWAEWLQPETWGGLRLGELTNAIERQTRGVVFAEQLGHPELHVQRARMTVSVDGTEHVFEATTLVDRTDGEHRRLLIRRA